MFNLKTILRLNAASCIGFGALFTALPGTVALFLSQAPAPTWLFIILGIGLIVNGLHLLWTSTKPLPSKNEVLYFSGGDFSWVLATIALVVCGLWISTTAGIVAALVTAAMVGSLGASQMIIRKKMGHC